MLKSVDVAKAMNITNVFVVIVIIIIVFSIVADDAAGAVPSTRAVAATRTPLHVSRNRTLSLLVDDVIALALAVAVAIAIVVVVVVCIDLVVNDITFEWLAHKGRAQSCNFSFLLCCS